MVINPAKLTSSKFSTIQRTFQEITKCKIHITHNAFTCNKSNNNLYCKSSKLHRNKKTNHLVSDNSHMSS